MRAIDAQHYWIAARFERREGWDATRYPFNLAVVRNLDELVFHPKVTFLVGENGAGKSTLIEALAVAWGFNPEGGSKNFNFGTRPSHSDLHAFVRPVRSTKRARHGYFLRAESDFNVATQIEALDEDPSGGPRIIIATHSPIILGYPDAWVYQATPKGLERVDYEDTDHYQVTRNFLNRRAVFLEALLGEE